MKREAEQQVKVLHVITGLNIGGAEMMLYKILRENTLLEKQVPVVVSLMSRGPIADQIENLGVVVHCLGVSRSQLPKLKQVRELFKIVNKFRPHVIQGWMYHGNIASLLIYSRFLFRPKLIWSIRQTLYNINNEKRLTKILIRLCSLLSRMPSKIIYNSVVSAEQHEKYGFSSSRRFIIPNGFDVNVFKPNKNMATEFRKKINIPEDVIVVGHVARYHAMKDHEMLLLAAKEVVDNNQNYYFVLVGTDVDKKNRKLQQVLAGIKNRERICLLGERSDIPNIMSGLNIFVMSSLWGEGFPNAVGEAMSSGVTCIVTDVGDSAVVVGDTGFVIKPGDYVALAKVILEYGQLSDNERNALSESARLRIEDNYSINNVTTKYNSVYFE